MVGRRAMGEVAAEVRSVDFSYFATRSYGDFRAFRIKRNSGVQGGVALIQNRPDFTGFSRLQKWLNRTVMSDE